MNSQKLSLAIQEQYLPGSSLVEKWAFAQQAGYGAIELRAAGDYAFRERLPELKAALAEGVVMPTVCPEMTHFVGDFDPARREDAIHQVSSMLSVVAELGGLGVMTPAAWGMFSRRLPPFDPPRSADDDQMVLVDGLGRLADHARREGVLLLLEPLNRYEDHMVNTLQAAASLIDQVGNPSLRIVADLFHLNIEEQNVPSALIAHGGLIESVQVNDTNRAQPGTGHMAWAEIFDALRTIGYEGWLTVECAWRGDRDIAVAEVPRFLGPWL